MRRSARSVARCSRPTSTSPSRKELVKKVEERAVGQEVLRSLSPGQQVVRVVHEVLVETLGGQGATSRREPRGADRILIVGLQGSGKTTFVAKLGHHLRGRKQIAAGRVRPGSTGGDRSARDARASGRI